jgi:predicted GTPase
MRFGAGTVAAREGGVAAVIDPRPFAVGSIAEAFRTYTHLEQVLPALGYSDAQRQDLARTITLAAPELVVDASPAGVVEMLGLAVPCVRARYTFDQVSGPRLEAVVDETLDALARRAHAEEAT